MKGTTASNKPDPHYASTVELELTPVRRIGEAALHVKLLGCVNLVRTIVSPVPRYCA